MPTIRQLAKLAGVSISTVSRALSGHPYVDEAKRARILKLAEEYHYAPNRISQGVLSGKSGLIGVIVADTGSPFHSLLLKGMLAQCFADSYRALVLETRSEVAYTCQAMAAMTELRVEGVIVASGHEEEIPRSALLKVWSHEIPIVLLDNTSSALPVDRVRTDEQAFGNLVVEYLRSLGHRHIAFINPSGNPASALRTLAVRDALHRIGLSTEFFYPTTPPADIATCVDEMLATPHRPTAIIAFNDFTAAYLMKELSRRGYRIPRDFSLLGCGNLHFSDFLIPELTTVEQHPEEVGKQAIKLLLQRIDEKCYRNAAVEEILVQPHFIKRNSCGVQQR
ncbi:MAG TPA: LacI family DNA-binding transcriptional regulator [Armatimonadota bacterium]|nr:LacI family DNA-binding transcriptional regulator [Armatimonadota bacterium]